MTERVAMSLNDRERQRTGAELASHADALGMGAADLAPLAGTTPDVVAAVLRMDDTVSPVDVWAVRDALEGERGRRGLDAGDWSVLSDDARRRALMWFPLRDVRGL